MYTRPAMQRSLIAVAVAALAASLDAPARADVDARSLLAVASRPAGAGSPLVVPHAFLLPGTDRIPLVVELPAAVDARSFGLVAAAPGFATTFATPDELDRLAGEHPDWRMSWSPPRHPLLDRAAQWVRAPRLTSPSGGRGAGVIVGVIDTGIDAAHPDLLDAAGKTRVRWIIDFSRKPAATQAGQAFEDKYGCTKNSDCAVFSNDDIDELITNSVEGDEPKDEFGHGTHVTSLAAGNGLFNDPPLYVGIAPEATLIIARVSRDSSGTIFDPDIVRAASFVFDRADELGMPVVVNLSLGSDFGAHDGSSGLERHLAAFVGPGKPGRSIVVAAGNSAGLAVPRNKNYPTPLGVHTELSVPQQSDVRVPILTPSDPTKKQIEGTVFVWVGMRPGDSMDVGVDGQNGTLVDPLQPGDAGTFKRGDLDVTIFDGPSGPPDQSQIAPGTMGAVVTFDGKWDSGAVFALRLHGHGTASIWVQGERDADGVLLPRAQKDGTVNVPATHPLLIAAGATLNRLDWPIHTGEPPMHVDVLGSVLNPLLDSVGYFSSGGPTATGIMKPDIVAPGVFVVGAMSKDADPRKNGGVGLFNESPELCAAQYPDDATPPLCFVVDAAHAVASGTSMAAPIVSGAVAVLLERNPKLTQPEIINLLQAGARYPQGNVTVPRELTAPLSVQTQMGPGALDIAGTLSVMDAIEHGNDREPSQDQSWLALASPIARPDPSWPLDGVLELRDVDGNIADGFEPSRLAIRAWPATSARLQRADPGMYRLEVAVPAGTGNQVLNFEVTFDGVVFKSQSVPIAVDEAVAEEGVEARGGCATTRSRADGSTSITLMLIGSGWMLARRRRRAVRPQGGARNHDRRSLHCLARKTVQRFGSNGAMSGSNG